MWVDRLKVISLLVTSKFHISVMTVAGPRTLAVISVAEVIC
jgi:hypothetical protein